MDVYCARCGEPWDNDEFHEVAHEFESDYDTVTTAFRRFGCAVMSIGPDVKAPGFKERMCEIRNTMESLAAQAAFEVCGDDMDGAAALMDDSMHMFGGEE